MTDLESGMTFKKVKLRLQERADIRKRNKETIGSGAKWKFYYTNGFDHDALPVVTMEKPDEVQLYKWGLIPGWTKDREQANKLQNETLNAKSETVFDLPSFKGSIFTKRCLIPAHGFYEWRHIHGKKYPYHVMIKDDDFPDSTREFCFGGIYSHWVDDVTGEVANTFSIITVPANKVMSKVHNVKQRMPLILFKEDETVWLEEGLDESHIKVLMQPYPDKLTVAHTISRLITSDGVRDSPDLLTAVAYKGVEEWIVGGNNMDEGPEQYEQGSLF